MPPPIRIGFWVAEITYIATWAGFLYLSVVVDAWSWKVVGWAIATHLRTQLVLDALNMALWQRRPREVIHDSDQGTQYTSLAFGQRCREAGVVPRRGQSATPMTTLWRRIRSWYRTSRRTASRLACPPV